MHSVSYAEKYLAINAEIKYRKSNRNDEILQRPEQYLEQSQKATM